MKPDTQEEALLREKISHREQQLEEALKDLVGAAEARASLGHYVGRYPWHILGGAVLFGIWLGRRSQPVRGRTR